MRFKDFGIREDVITRLIENGMVEATPVQEKSIPKLLRGKDVIAKAQTGTGKTLAFLLPILEKVNIDNHAVQALILTPTRELAIQVTSEFEKINPESSGIRVLSVYGGQDVEKQIRKLGQAVHIVIATPGRLLDHLNRGTVRLGSVSMLVLDEADQMLNMGFLNEVEEIIGRTPSSRQTMLFSATIPAVVRHLAKRYMKAPEDVRIEEQQITVKDIKQLVFETTDRAKQDTLCAIIDQHRPYLAIIFCRTKRRASKLNEALQTRGFLSDELHGDLSQSKREQVMQRFRDAKLQLLVATDVAARGLDVVGVTHVFNYDIPHDAESYIHRIGRTGRAGESGLAITLMSQKDRPYLELIEKGIKMRLVRRTIDVVPSNHSVVVDDEDDRPTRRGRGRQSAGGTRSGSRRSEQGGKAANRGGSSHNRQGEGNRNSIRGTRAKSGTGKGGTRGFNSGQDRTGRRGAARSGSGRGNQNRGRTSRGTR